MDEFFDEIGSALLLLLILVLLTKEENDTIEEKAEDRLAADIPAAAHLEEQKCYIFRSSNRKKLRPKTVYF